MWQKSNLWSPMHARLEIIRKIKSDSMTPVSHKIAESMTPIANSSQKQGGKGKNHQQNKRPKKYFK